MVNKYFSTEVIFFLYVLVGPKLTEESMYTISLTGDSEIL